MKLNKTYWEERYETENTGWDIGSVSSPLKAYIDQLTNKDLKILVPGAGNGYEAIYLHEQGFKNTYVVDIAAQPLASIKERYPNYPKEQLVHEDFFKVPLDNFDLVLEQTFFCALDPSLRNDYITKMTSLLKVGGKLAGLFFNFPLTKEGPPFGGSEKQYRDLICNSFDTKILAEAYNSITPRAGKELFFIFTKK